MRLKTTGCALVVLFFGIATFVQAQAAKSPLTDRQLIALVSGGALSGNIVHDIASRGLAFRPDEEYRTLLTTAGADEAVLSALTSAKAADAGPSATDGADGLLQNLATAGKLIRAKQFKDADDLLTKTLPLQFNGGSETGFVMAESLRGQSRWAEAEDLYSEVLRRDPNFPEVHVKLSFVLYRAGNQQEALRETKIALAENPENAEAHKNAGLAWSALRDFTVAEQEYREALRIQPDYAAVFGDLGLMLYDQKKFDAAIDEYKKAIVLDPEDSEMHAELGAVYHDKGDLDSAIREYREAKRIDPADLDARRRLGGTLMDHDMDAQAIVELRELEAMAPDSPLCHYCLGEALYRTSNFDVAEQEFRKAISLDPSDSRPHMGLGNIREQQKKYDEALSEYRQAKRLDENDSLAYRDSGRVFLATNDLPQALSELKRAEELDPGDAYGYDLYGQALETSGNHAAAIAQFKQSLALEPDGNPDGMPVRLRLAAALENNRNWADALDQYRQAASADPRNAAAQYKAAQQRVDKVISSMETSGATAEAAKLRASIQASRVEPGISERLDLALQAGTQALSSGRLDQAEKSFKDALDLAQRLQPHDDRLTAALIAMANVYAGKKDFVHTEASLQQALKASQDLHGADSPMTTQPLQALGDYAAFRQDYNSALDFDQRAIAINEKTFGEASDKVADSLRILSNVYVQQKDYANAEAVLLRAVRINDAIFGADGGDPLSMAPLWSLCGVYEAWEKPDKAEPCYAKELKLVEGKYGASNPGLLDILASDARALRKLGKSEQADAVDRRAQSIQAAQTNPN